MKTKKYWLRGGIIAIPVILLISEGLMISETVRLASNPLFIFARWIGMVIYYPGSFILAIPIFVLEAFAIGSFIGWIYGRKQRGTTMK